MVYFEDVIILGVRSVGVRSISVGWGGVMEIMCGGIRAHGCRTVVGVIVIGGLE